jgi:autotransporter-associated beta strand protein
VNATGRIDIWGTVTDSGSGYVLTKTGTGECLDFRGSIASLGGLQIDQGRVRYENASLASWTGPITVSSSAVFSTYGTYTLTNPFTLAGGVVGAEASGTITLNGPISVTAASTIDCNSGSTTIGGTVSGTAGLTTAGTNTLTFAASNSVGSLAGVARLTLNSGVNLTTGSNGTSTLYTGQVTGQGSLTKTGAGTMTLSRSTSTFSGGAKVSAGTLVSTTPGALGTGTVTLDGGTLVLGSATSLSGFGGSGTGWTLNNGATASGDVLTVTTATASLARSAYYNQLVSTGSFTMSFDYLADNKTTGEPADGLAVVFQTSTSGTTALGASGGGLGYTGVTPSKAWGINLYPTASQGIASQVWTNGSISGYTTGTGISYYGTTVHVVLTYDDTAKTLTADLAQGSTVYSKTYTSVDLTGSLGNAAYFGFSGGTGGANAQQAVSNFTFTSTGTVNTAYSNPVAVSPAATGNLRLLATTAASNYSMGALSMGTGAALSLAPSSGSTSGQAYGLTLGPTTLAGNATFDVANNGAGLGTLTLGAVGQTATAGLTKTGAGKLLLSANNTYTGNTTVSGGTLALAGGLANNIAGSPTIDVQRGATLDVTALAGGTIALTGGASPQKIQGNGTITGMIGGAGLVGPGTSPGILTAAAVVPTAGLDFAFELTAATPDYTNPSTSPYSRNDVLRLTDTTTPFTAALTGDNVVDVCFNMASVSLGDTFLGGFYTDREAAFLDLVEGADFNYWIRDDAGSQTFNGVNYSPFTETVGLATVLSPAAFDGGATVNGFVLQFSVVPEPSTFALGGIAGSALLGWCLRRRRSNPAETRRL